MTDGAPWPRLGDVLFSDEGGQLNACLGWTHDQWSRYADGYRQAAELLVVHVATTQNDQDSLVFPIVFLYRQALEISLKRLIWMDLLLQDRRPRLPAHHKLVPLWQQCRQAIERAWPHGPKQDLDAVGDVLAQFESRDPGSTAFRYPVTKEGRASHRELGQIDLQCFSEVAERAFALLDGCAMGFREHLQYKWDQESQGARW